MARLDTLRVALAMSIALGIAAVVGAVSMSQDRPGLPVGDLVRVETVNDVASPVLADHVAWSFSLFSGAGTIVEADLASRFAPSFAAGFTAADLNARLAQVNEDVGSISFVRYRGWDETAAEAIGVNAQGLPFFVPVEVAPDGRMLAWGLDDLDLPPRLPGWHAGLVLLAGVLFIASALSSMRAGRHAQAWALLAGALVSIAGVMVLSNHAGAYTLGRVLAPATAVVAVWLLLRLGPHPSSTPIVTIAVVGALALAVAPLSRDATIVGHPRIVMALVDSAALYRVLLVGGNALVSASLICAALLQLRNARRVGSARRAPLAAAALVASVWGLALLGSGVDYLVGNGVFAGGALQGVALGALAGVPLVVVFEMVTSRWDRPELAELVIDLESGDLQRAVANALDDPSAAVLTSPDGERLENDAGEVVVATDDGVRLARIHSGGKLIGGLVLGSGASHHPERLEAVTAAVGMALEVGRLNEQVTAQLAEVEASRARIVRAADEARRGVERDLHDGAQQRLVALGLDLQRARRMAGTAGHEDLAALLDTATQSVRDTIGDVRSVSRGSDPPLLSERGLAAAVDALVERAPVPVSVEITDTLRPSVERTAYFVIAEGLTNVAKHSGASGVRVRVVGHGSNVLVEVSDDGAGGASVAAGSGLQGLQDRTEAANGRFHIESSVAGTTIQAVLPCE